MGHEITGSLIQSGSIAEFHNGVSIDGTFVANAISASSFVGDGSNLTNVAGISIVTVGGGAGERLQAGSGSHNLTKFRDWTFEVPSGQNQVELNQVIISTTSSVFEPNEYIWYQFKDIGNDGNYEFVRVQEGGPESSSYDLGTGNYYPGFHRFYIQAVDTGSGLSGDAYATVTIRGFVNNRPTSNLGDDLTIQIPHDETYAYFDIQGTGSSDPDGSDFIRNFTMSRVDYSDTSKPQNDNGANLYNFSMSFQSDDETIYDDNYIASSSDYDTNDELEAATGDGINPNKLVFRGNISNYAYTQRSAGDSPEQTIKEPFSLKLIDNNHWSYVKGDDGAMPGDSLTTTLSHMTASIISPPTASIRNLRVEFEKHYKDGNGVQSRDVRMLYGYSASLSSDEVLTIPSMYTSSAVVRMRVCADIEEPPGDYEHTTSVWVIKGGGSNTHASAQFNDLNSDWSSGITKWFYLHGEGAVTSSGGWQEIYFGRPASPEMDTYEFLIPSTYITHGNHNHFRVENNIHSGHIRTVESDPVIIKHIAEVEVTPSGSNEGSSSRATTLLYGFTSSLDNISQITDRFPEVNASVYTSSMVRARILSEVTESFGPLHHPYQQKLSTQFGNSSNFVFSTSSVYQSGTEIYTQESESEPTYQTSSKLTAKYTSSWVGFDFPYLETNIIITPVVDGNYFPVSERIPSDDDVSTANVDVNKTEPVRVTSSIYVEGVDSGSNNLSPHREETILYGDSSIRTSPDNLNFRFTSSIIRMKLKTEVFEPFGPLHHTSSVVIGSNYSGNPYTRNDNFWNNSEYSYGMGGWDIENASGKTAYYDTGWFVPVDNSGDGLISTAGRKFQPTTTHTVDGELSSQISSSNASVKINSTSNKEILSASLEIETYGYSDIGKIYPNGSPAIRTVLYGRTDTEANSGSFDSHTSASLYASHSITRFRILADVREPRGPKHSLLKLRGLDYGASNGIEKVGKNDGTDFWEFETGSSDMENISWGYDSNYRLTASYTSSWSGKDIDVQSADYFYVPQLTGVSNYVYNEGESLDVHPFVYNYLLVNDTPDVKIKNVILETEPSGNIGFSDRTDSTRTILYGDETTRKDGTGLESKYTASSVTRGRILFDVEEPLGPLVSQFRLQNFKAGSTLSTPTNDFTFSTSSMVVSSVGTVDGLFSTYTSSWYGFELSRGVYELDYTSISILDNSTNEGISTIGKTQYSLVVNPTGSVNIEESELEVEQFPSSSGVGGHTRSTTLLYGESMSLDVYRNESKYNNSSLASRDLNTESVRVRLLTKVIEPFGPNSYKLTKEIGGGGISSDVIFTASEADSYTSEFDKGNVAIYTSSFEIISLSTGNYSISGSFKNYEGFDYTLNPSQSSTITVEPTPPTTYSMIEVEVKDKYYDFSVGNSRTSTLLYDADKTLLDSDSLLLSESGETRNWSDLTKEQRNQTVEISLKARTDEPNYYQPDGVHFPTTMSVVSDEIVEPLVIYKWDETYYGNNPFTSSLGGGENWIDVPLQLGSHTLSTGSVTHNHSIHTDGHTPSIVTVESTPDVQVAEYEVEVESLKSGSGAGTHLRSTQILMDSSSTRIIPENDTDDNLGITLDDYITRFRILFAVSESYTPMSPSWSFVVDSISDAGVNDISYTLVSGSSEVSEWSADDETQYQNTSYTSSWKTTGLTEGTHSIQGSAGKYEDVSKGSTSVTSTIHVEAPTTSSITDIDVEVEVTSGSNDDGNFSRTTTLVYGNSTTQTSANSNWRQVLNDQIVNVRVKANILETIGDVDHSTKLRLQGGGLDQDVEFSVDGPVTSSWIPLSANTGIHNITINTSESEYSGSQYGAGSTKFYMEAATPSTVTVLATPHTTMSKVEVEVENQLSSSVGTHSRNAKILYGEPLTLDTDNVWFNQHPNYNSYISESNVRYRVLLDLEEHYRPESSQFTTQVGDVTFTFTASNPGGSYNESPSNETATTYFTSSWLTKRFNMGTNTLTTNGFSNYPGNDIQIGATTTSDVNITSGSVTASNIEVEVEEVGGVGNGTHSTTRTLLYDEPTTSNNATGINSQSFARCRILMDRKEPFGAHTATTNFVFRALGSGDNDISSPLYLKTGSAGDGTSVDTYTSNLELSSSFTSSWQVLDLNNGSKTLEVISVGHDFDIEFDHGLDSDITSTIVINDPPPVEIKNIRIEVESGSYGSGIGSGSRNATVLYGDKHKTRNSLSNLSDFMISESIIRARVLLDRKEPVGHHHYDTTTNLDSDNALSPDQVNTPSFTLDSEVNGDGNFYELTSSWALIGLYTSSDGSGQPQFLSTQSFSHPTSYTVDGHTAAEVLIHDTPPTEIKNIEVEISDADNTSGRNSITETILYDLDESIKSIDSYDDIFDHNIIRYRVKADIQEPLGKLHHPTTNIKIDDSDVISDDDTHIFTFSTESSDVSGEGTNSSTYSRQGMLTQYTSDWREHRFRTGTSYLAVMTQSITHNPDDEFGYNYEVGTNSVLVMNPLPNVVIPKYEIQVEQEPYGSNSWGSERTSSIIHGTTATMTGSNFYGNSAPNISKNQRVKIRLSASVYEPDGPSQNTKDFTATIPYTNDINGSTTMTRVVDGNSPLSGHALKGYVGGTDHTNHILEVTSWNNGATNAGLTTPTVEVKAYIRANEQTSSEITLSPTSGSAHITGSGVYNTTRDIMFQDSTYGDDISLTVKSNPDYIVSDYKQGTEELSFDWTEGTGRISSIPDVENTTFDFDQNNPDVTSKETTTLSVTATDNIGGETGNDSYAFDLVPKQPQTMNSKYWTDDGESISLSDGRAYGGHRITGSVTNDTTVDNGSWGDSGVRLPVVSGKYMTDNFRRNTLGRLYYGTLVEGLDNYDDNDNAGTEVFNVFKSTAYKLQNTEYSMSFGTPHIDSGKAFNLGDSGSIIVNVNGTEEVNLNIQNLFVDGLASSQQSYPPHKTPFSSGKGYFQMLAVKNYGNFSEDIGNYNNGWQVWEGRIRVHDKLRDGYNYIELTHSFSDGLFPEQHLKKFDWYYDDDLNEPSFSQAITETTFSLGLTGTATSRSLSGIKYYQTSSGVNKYNFEFDGIVDLSSNMLPINEDSSYNLLKIQESDVNLKLGNNNSSINYKLGDNNQSNTGDGKLLYITDGVKYAGNDPNPDPPYIIATSSQFGITDLSMSMDSLTSPHEVLGKVPNIKLSIYGRDYSTNDTFQNSGLGSFYDQYAPYYELPLGRFIALQNSYANVSTEDFLSENNRWASQSMEVSASFNFNHQINASVFNLYYGTENVSGWTGNNEQSGYSDFWLNGKFYNTRFGSFNTIGPDYNSDQDISINTTEESSSLQQTVTGSLRYPTTNFSSDIPLQGNYSGLAGQRYWYRAFKINNWSSGTQFKIKIFTDTLTFKDLFNRNLAGFGGDNGGPNVNIDIRFPGPLPTDTGGTLQNSNSAPGSAWLNSVVSSDEITGNKFIVDGAPCHNLSYNNGWSAGYPYYNSDEGCWQYAVEFNQSSCTWNFAATDATILMRIRWKDSNNWNTNTVHTNEVSLLNWNGTAGDTGPTYDTANIKKITVETI